VKLRRRFETAESSAEKATTLGKLSRVAPWLVEEWRQQLEPVPPAQEKVARRRTQPAPGGADRPGRRAAEEVGRPETTPREDVLGSR
jgi:hypothetical protein